MPHAAAGERVLLTIPQAADLLGIHRATVYRLIADGALPVTDLSTTRNAAGRKTAPRIRRDAIDAFIESRTRTASALRA